MVITISMAAAALKNDVFEALYSCRAQLETGLKDEELIDDQVGMLFTGFRRHFK